MLRRKARGEVGELDHHARVVRVHRLGKLAIPREHRVVKIDQHVHLRCAAGPMHHGRPGHAERNAPARLAQVVGNFLVADEAIEIVDGGMGRADDSIAQFERSNIQRG